LFFVSFFILLFCNFILPLAPSGSFSSFPGLGP